MVEADLLICLHCLFEQRLSKAAGLLLYSWGQLSIRQAGTQC